MNRPLLSLVAVVAASFASLAVAAPRIARPIDETQRVTLEGNTRPEARAENDYGAVDDALPLEHMLLLLQRSPERSSALDAFVAAQNAPGAPEFHQWLTAQEFGARFGADDADVGTVAGWLGSHGFTVHAVHGNRMVIDFSGNAGQVRAAFQTEIHYLWAKGDWHVANMSDPSIPEALSPAVAGVVSLNDFRPRPMRTTRPAYTLSTGYQLVAPADLATIYDLNPLFSSGLTGQGETIAVIEDTDLYSAADWTTFRSTFGLGGYAGTLATVHPGSCKNPGVNADDFEAIIDAEWASAAAPSAAIEVASCADTRTTFGGLIAIQNLVNGANPPAIISLSYGECEAANGATANAAYAAIYQQATAEGVSVFVSAGDEGAASCDADESNATHGIGVSGFASTPYNVAVGGTDFGDLYSNTVSTYWSSTNSATYGSALSYVPEIPWNDSCAGGLLSSYEGYATPYGKAGFCNSTTGKEYFLTTTAGSGGPSGCATGSPSTQGVVSGKCKGYPKPSWQSLVGNPSDGVRDIPDVSLFAANGVWGHYYPVCYSDTANGGTACTGAPSTWTGAGGTSFASPILGGIQAIVDQKWGLQGNPNPTYYRIAASEYGATGNASCSAQNAGSPASACVFNDVTLGDMDINCTGNHSCYLPSGRYGVLSTSQTTDAPAFGTSTGWDFATGIGSLNAYNLVNSTSW